MISSIQMPSSSQPAQIAGLQAERGAAERDARASAEADMIFAELNAS
jgi:hypothetical protein